MSKLNVAIFKLPALYEILIEIKSELDLNLFNFTENNGDFKEFITTNPYSLIISSEKNKKKLLPFFQEVAISQTRLINRTVDNNMGFFSVLRPKTNTFCSKGVPKIYRNSASNSAWTSKILLEKK